MATFKNQLFQQYANEGLKTVIGEFQTKYEVKKEERFNYNGITYEIGNARAVEGNVEFEISSKIPQDELSSKVTLQDYFQAIHKMLLEMPEKPKAVDMENITREMGGNERKERDYARLRYAYTEKELYNEKALMIKADILAQSENTSEIPDIPGVTTLMGKMILAAIRETIYLKAKQGMQDLIDANENARNKLILKKK